MDRRTGEAGNALSYLDFQDLRAARSFEGIAAVDSRFPASVGLDGDFERMWGALVTANFFSVTRPAFVLGRGFDANRDDTPGEPPVVVLTHHLWQSRFGGDPGILGRSIAINDRPATVVGVTEAGFTGTEAGIVSDFWIPFSMLDEVESRLGPITKNRRRHWLSAVGRLRSGVDARAAGGELDIIASSLNVTFADGDQNRGFHAGRRAVNSDQSGRGSARDRCLDDGGGGREDRRTAAASGARKDKLARRRRLRQELEKQT